MIDSLKENFLAQIIKPIVTCGTRTTDPCTLNDLLKLINILVEYLLGIVILLATLSFAVAGFYYLAASYDESKVKRAHEIFKDALIGVALAFGAWLIINSILLGLGVEGTFNPLK